MSLRYAVGCAVLVLTTAICSAQSSKSRDSWLMQNYRFTGPPPPGPVQPTDPVMSQLQEIQNTTLNILRKANFDGDYEAALAAAAQAAANAQLIGALTERRQQQPAQRSQSSPEETTPAPKAAVYLIALRDRSIQAATSYWTDGTMLHCITLEGAHEQIRLDLVDRERSGELNRRSNVEFRLPDLKQQSY
jgi:hypothetical protein